MFDLKKDQKIKNGFKLEMILFKIISFLAIIGSAVVVFGDQSIGLRVSPSAESVNQPSSQQFVVTCRGFGAEPPLFSNLRWYDPRGQEIDVSYSQRINPDIKVEELEVGALLLHFLNPIPDNSGSYRCAATFQHSDSLETKIQITFFQDVQWEDCPSIQSLVLGATNERIRCKASANPKPSITWTKDDKHLERRFQIDANGIAINDVIRESDGGVFRVRALVTETGRLHDTFITVQVFVKPQITGLPERFEGIEGLETTLKCEASGRPQPLMTWLDPNRRNLSSVGGYSVDRQSGALIISRVKKIDDSGYFTCISDNDAGSDQKTTLLVVSRRPTITSFANISFSQNENSVLECRANGDPRPEMTIRRDGDSRELVIGDPRVGLERREENEETVLKLVLTQTMRSDDGLYFCRAVNSGGVAERAGHIEVRFPPDMSRTPLTSVKSWDLQPINVSCIADAIPNATIRWRYRNDYIFNDNVFTIIDDSLGSSRLVINVRAAQQREVFGQYRCLGINSLGENEIRIQVDRAHKPGAILQASTERVTPTSVLFRVLAPTFDGGLPITVIHAQFRSEHNSEQITRKWPLDPRETYFVDGLRPRTRYWFKFSAQNMVGIGDWSVERQMITERESRPEKPQFRNVPVDVISGETISPFPDKMTITWSLPSDNGRKIRFFEIKCFRARKTEFGFEAFGEQSVSSVSMNEQSMTSFTQKNLKSNSYYRIEIRANNDLGFSDVSSLVFKTSEGSEEEEEEKEIQMVSSSSLSLMIGLAICVIIVLLIATDAFFFFRYKIGLIFFLTKNAFPKREEIENIPKAVENRAFDGRRENEPFFGRASAV